ncbi:MAG: Initiator RepB protein [Gammaproteobacteria bacterium]|nr:Initiator RepB protein [Gammaproteobacteria bacterium]
MALSNNKQIQSSLIRKHVNAIHCSNNLTLVQRKLFNAILLNAYHDLPTKSQYQISIKNLCELIGYDSRDYKKLRKSFLDLITTAIEWSIIDHENEAKHEKWRASSIISAAKIENGICTYEFSSIMRELLYRPEMYGKIDVKIMVQFQSGYGLALYENCIRFKGISQTPWFPTSIFRKLMGVPQDYYQNFCDFKKRVLDVAVKEVNKYSPINVVPEITRLNKKVTSIRFKLSDNGVNNKETNNVTINNNNAELANMLRVEFCLSSETIADILLRYGVEYIKQKIDLIKNSDSFKLGKIRGLAAYLMDALKRDYRQNKSSGVFAAEVRNTQEIREIINKEQEEGHRFHKNEKAKRQVKDYLAKLSQEELNQLIIQFEEYLQVKDSFYSFKKYKKSGIEEPIVRAIFNTFVMSVMATTVVSMPI